MRTSVSRGRPTLFKKKKAFVRLKTDENYFYECSSDLTKKKIENESKIMALSTNTHTILDQICAMAKRAKFQTKTRFKDILAFLVARALLIRAQSYEEDSKKTRMIQYPPVGQAGLSQSLPKAF